MIPNPAMSVRGELRRAERSVELLIFWLAMRLRRPMSGKALPFRLTQIYSEAAPPKVRRSLKVICLPDGEPQAHRSSGGTAALA